MPVPRIVLKRDSVEKKAIQRFSSLIHTMLHIKDRALLDCFSFLLEEDGEVIIESMSIFDEPKCRLRWTGRGNIGREQSITSSFTSSVDETRD